MPELLACASRAADAAATNLLGYAPLPIATAQRAMVSTGTLRVHSKSPCLEPAVIPEAGPTKTFSRSFRLRHRGRAEAPQPATTARRPIFRPVRWCSRPIMVWPLVPPPVSALCGDALRALRAISLLEEFLRFSVKGRAAKIALSGNVFSPPPSQHLRLPQPGYEEIWRNSCSPKTRRRSRSKG